MAIVKQLRVKFKTRHVTAEIYIASVGARGRRDSSSFCPAIVLQSISVEGRVSAFKTFDIYASACSLSASVSEAIQSR
ncbi:MAG TPA: hypothetical protein VMR88_08820, partial [Candidatus Polarisedimenticolaceae bacterium]|nr:hypothetical protein [Candidatus Polarisedimenticolaceae bacterium]